MREKVILLSLVMAIVSTVSAVGQIVFPGGLAGRLASEGTDLLEPVDSAEVVAEEFAFLYPDTMARRVTIPGIKGNYRPMVFDTFVIFDPLKISVPEQEAITEPFYWVSDAEFSLDLARRARQRYMIDYPWQVRYNERSLPEPPKHYRAVVDPSTAKIVLTEEAVATNVNLDIPVEIKRRNWLHSFAGSVHFSQAYVSPNWYQGGNNNLNVLINAVFNVKLNPAFHPKLLFETTAAYKLGLNSAPDDSLRNYSISEDLLQINTKFGYKAAHHWYYSMTAQFKTQLLNNYKTNTRTLQAAFMSPSELNVGVGMTYNYASPSGKLTFDASISPLSWNMKTCFHPDMNPGSFGIKPGHKTVHEIGSSAEGKLMWKMTNNISYQSRLFMFTDYDYYQGDWENTFSFQINRFLSTKIYVHLRYDSSTPYNADTRWHVWQLKEILSFGFDYKFNTF